MTEGVTFTEQPLPQQPQQPQPPQQPQQNGGNGAAVEAAPPKKPEKWIGRLPLRKPVVANENRNCTELTFREPTGGDIETVGCPIILSVFEAQPKPVFDGPIMTGMMAQLAGVPPSTIRQMDPRDWQNGAMMLFHFFVPDRFIT
jgi:hypothetical protein